MAEVTKDKRAELEAEYGEIYVHERSGLVFRTPRKVEWQFFINAVGRDKGDRAVAMESLARQCAVFPDGAAVAAAFEKKPGLPLAVYEGIAKLAGVEEDIPKLSPA